MASIPQRTSYIYTLGYPSPATSKKRGFRKIKVKCTRRGVTLYHRAGYFPG